MTSTMVQGPLERRHLTPLWSALLVLAAVLYAAVVVGECFGGPVGVYDDCLYYYSALLVGRGQSVHLDFRSVYPPLNYQLAGWMFSLLGETVLAVRLLHLGLYFGFLAGLAAFFKLKGITGPRLAMLLLASLVLTATLPMLPSFPGVCLALYAVLAYLYSLEARSMTRRRVARAIAGALAALTLFTRVNCGLYAIAVFGADGLLALVQARGDSTGWRRRRVIELAELAAVTFGGSLILAAMFRRQIPALVEQVLVAPSVALWTYSKPAFEPNGTGIVGLALLGFTIFWVALRASSVSSRRAWLALGVVIVALGFFAGTLSPRLFALLVLSAILAPLVNQLTSAALPRGEFAALLSCAVFLHYYVSLPDFAHQFPATAPVAFLLPVFLAEKEAWPVWQRRAAVALVALLALPIALRTARLRRDAIVGFQVLAQGWPRASDAARIAESRGTLAAPLSKLFPDEYENQVVRFLRPQLAADEPVYAGLQDHSRPYVNDMRLYFTLGQPHATRHFMLTSGISNTPEAQAEMVSDLGARGVRWIVLWRGSAGYPSFQRQNLAGIRLLDDYLAAKYRPVATFGPFEIRHRR